MKHSIDDRRRHAVHRRPPAGRIEANGINVIDESERKGTAGLFWPWSASNISVLAVSYGAFCSATA